MMKNSTLQVTSPRGGSTLVEVLMALLVVSVGVSSLAVMFPLSILRSIEATQLTSATVLRRNAEELIDSFPALVFDPRPNGLDGDRTTNADNSIYKENYIVDPLGWNIYDPAQQDLVGDSSLVPLPIIERYHGALFTPAFPNPTSPAAPPTILDSEVTAAGIAAAGDNWTTLMEDIGTLTGTANEIDLPGADLAGLTFVPGSGILHRVVIFDVTGKFSQTRVVTGITGTVLTLAADLPAGFTTAGNVRLQTQDRRYTWLLTVRTELDINFRPLTADIDVVVFFKRGYSTDDEFEYTTFTGEAFEKGSNTVSIQYDGTQPEPSLKKGGFLFDSENARWYRILDFEEVTQPEVGFKITLDRSADETSLGVDAGKPQGKAMLMRGIVDVYHLANKTSPPIP